MFALTADAVVLPGVARRLGNRFAAGGGHLLFAAARAWLVVRLLFIPPRGLVVANATALINLTVVGLVFAASRIGAGLMIAAVYRLPVHLAVLGWLWNSLHVGVDTS